ncbi:MAG: Wzz/FepE/Etk N-terminal domain-containing protein [Solirubrobacterales bacterium]
MNQPRYSSLRDYLDVLRRQRWVVLAVTLVFGLAAFAVSILQIPIYASTASLSYTDVTDELRVLGLNVPGQAPLERAAANARTIATPEVAEGVSKRLDREIGPEALRSAVDTEIGADTAFVLIQATAEEPEVAARIANAYAEEAKEEARKQERERLGEIIRGFAAQGRDEEPTVGGQFDQVDQLRAIRAIAEPAEIVATAEPNSDPISPRPVRNTVLGLLVGLTFGLVAAFSRDSLDRRIRGPGQAYEALGYPVLSRIGEHAMGRVGQADPGEGSELEAAELEAFRMLRANMGIFAGEGPVKRVLVTSGLPEEGKSTVAVSLAAASAAAGKRTLLIDCDLRRPMVSTRLGIDESPGLVEYLQGAATPAEILRTCSINERTGPTPGTGVSNGSAAVAAPVVASAAAAPSLESGNTNEASPGPGAVDRGQLMVVIPAGRPTTEPAELLVTERCKRLLIQVGEAYDLVVIDSSPLLASVDPLELIPCTDAILLCVRSGTSTLEEVDAVQTALGMLPDRPVGVVLTGVKQSRDGYAGYGFYYGYERVS